MNKMRRSTKKLNQGIWSKASTADSAKQKKESMNSKMHHLKLASQWNKRKKEWERVKNTCVNYKTATRKKNMCIMWIPEGAEKEKGAERLSEELRTENFPNLWRQMNIHIHKTQRIQNRLNMKWSSMWQIIIKLSEVKDRGNFLKQQEKSHSSHTVESP